jgi:alpha-tubulin suppressor-like RCC1 family protein
MGNKASKPYPDFSDCRLFIPSVYSYSLLFCIFDMLQVIPEIRTIIVGLISILKTKVSIACGLTHTLLLTDNGEIFCWGSDFHNKDVHETDQNIPWEMRKEKLVDVN